MNRFIHYLAATVLGATGLVAISGSAEAVITPPTCPSTTLTRTGAQTTAVDQANSGGTWDLTGATWTNTSLGYPVNADPMNNGCIKGGVVDGGVSKTSTRDEWYDGVVANNEPDNRDAYIMQMSNTSGGTGVIKDAYAEDFEDAYDVQTDGTNTSVYLDHVEAKDIGDDCIENEGSSGTPDVPAQHVYVKNSLFDGCFTGIGWRPPGAVSDTEGVNTSASLTIEDTLMRIGNRPLGSKYCDSTDLSSGRCVSVPTSESDSGMAGLYGLWKWSDQAPVSSNVTIRNTIFRIDGHSYSSCKPFDWPTGATYDNVTVVWAGSGSYSSLCSGSAYALPSGVTLTTDTSVWSNAVAAWRNGGGNPPPTNQAPSVNAGTDQTVTLPSSANLNGTVSDDGLPSGSSVSSTWSKVSGPGTVTFGNANVVDTTASFSTSGTYVLQLSATDGSLTTTDTVQVTVNPAPGPTNSAPNVNAGTDQITTISSTTNLDGTVTDDGLPTGSTVTSTWSKVSGPGTVTFGNANAVDTTVSFSAIGTYVLQLSASDGALTGSDQVTVTVDEEVSIPNAKPDVNAGPDQTITLPDTAQMNATVVDPENDPLTYFWSTASGPAEATFSSRTIEDPSVSFSTAGTYVLELEVQDHSSNTPTLDYVTVTVNPAPVNESPTVNAGPDQTITLPDTAQMNATVTDAENDTISYNWWLSSGPTGQVTFSPNEYVEDPTVTFTQPGTYIFELEVQDPYNPMVTDFVTITVEPEPVNTPPEVDAGPDVTTIACGRDATGVQAGPSCRADLNGSVWDAEDGGEIFNAAWSVTSPSGLTTDDYEFNDSSDVDTAVYFAEAGTYVLKLQYTDNVGQTSSDLMVVNVNPPPAGVSYVGSAYAQGTANTVTVNMPSGAQIGDTIVFYVAQNQGSDRALGVPTGVTALGSQVNDGSSLGARLYAHTVSSTSPASFTFNATGTDTAYQLDASALAYRGVTSVTQVALTADSNSDALHPVSGTTANAGVNLVFASQHRYVSSGTTNASTFTLASTLTERVDNGAQSSSTNHAMSQVAGDTGSSVAAGAKTYSVTASQSSSYAISALVNLQ